MRTTGVVSRQRDPEVTKMNTRGSRGIVRALALGTGIATLVGVTACSNGKTDKQKLADLQKALKDAPRIAVSYSDCTPAQVMNELTLAGMYNPVTDSRKLEEKMVSAYASTIRPVTDQYGTQVKDLNEIPDLNRDDKFGLVPAYQGDQR